MGVFIYFNQHQLEQQQQQQQQQQQSNQSMNIDPTHVFMINDSHQFVGNSPRLAPHGAPTNPKWQTNIAAGERNRSYTRILCI
jgi:hypothetical protein